MFSWQAFIVAWVVICILMGVAYMTGFVIEKISDRYSREAAVLALIGGILCVTVAIGFIAGMN